MSKSPSQPRSIVIWSAEPDAELCKRLAKHMDPLVHNGRITLKHQGLALGGDQHGAVVEQGVDQAEVLLILVSVDSLSELQHSEPICRALSRQQRGELMVIPVLLRPALWEESVLIGLEPLPRNRRPVTQWEDPEMALLEVAQAVEATLPVDGLAKILAPPNVKLRLITALGLGIGSIGGVAGLTQPTVTLDASEVTNTEFSTWLNSRPVSVEQERFVREGEVLMTDLYRDANGGSGLRWSNGHFEPLDGMDRLPVVQVSFDAAVRYCAASGAHLPQQHEWLTAACGRWYKYWKRRSYPWGDETPRCDGVVYGRHNGACQHLPLGPVAVGTAAQDRTSQGHRDLGGNISEWVMEREVWGGDYARGVTECRNLLRVELPSDAVKSNIGFRCAR